MKWFSITLKDLSRSLRSFFLLAMMFGIPLVITAMFSFMFGSGSVVKEAESGQPPVAALANLDRPTEQGLDLGGELAAYLSAPWAADMIEVQPYTSEAGAIQAVDDGLAGAAVIIPEDFSASYAAADRPGVVRVYAGAGGAGQAAAGLTGALLAPYLDGLSSGKITAVIAAQAPPENATALTGAPDSAGTGLVAVRNPKGEESDSPDITSAIVGPILAGMMIFFTFFTGAACAENIVHEYETGTLARVFVSPTRITQILGGKFAAIALTVLIQVVVLIAAGALVFNIHWGGLGNLALIVLGTAACSTGFGIFITSLLKNSKQVGAVMGGLLPLTGMVGMMRVFASASAAPSPLLKNLSLIVPQGWAVGSLLDSMGGAPLGQIAVNATVMLTLAALFFAFGALRFSKRFA